MAENPKIKKFETTDLASFYKDNGSSFSSVRPPSGQFDHSGPKVETNSDKTPVSKLAQMVEDVSLANQTPEKKGQNVSFLPETPNKIGVDPSKFGETPKKIGTTTSAFGASPEKTTVEVFPTPSSPEKIGIDPAGFLFSPAFTGTNTSTFDFSPAFTGTTTSDFDFILPNHSAQLKIHNGMPDIDATGFTANQTYPNTDFIGVSGNEFQSKKISTQLKIHNGISDIDMSGFKTNKSHLDTTDFKGVTGDPGTMQYSMNTDNPGSTYAWTRMMYNDRVTTANNNIDNLAATGFTKYSKGQYKGGVSDFIGVDSESNIYDYPVNITFPMGSYSFNSFQQKEIGLGKRGTAKFGQGQEFDALGRTSPYGDASISARKQQFYNDSFDSRIGKQYVEIPGVGETDLRRESTNVHSFGNATDQPFIQRDIGSNWSLFSDSPAAKGGKGGLFGIDLIRGGVGTAINRSLIDALRIGKFLISPKGLLFIAKNVGMQLTNPKMQIDSLLGIGANRIYPLGLSTLAQTLTNAVGIHLIRHGLGPLNGTLPNKARYEDNVYHSFGSGGGGSGAKKAAKEAGLDVPDMSDVTGDVPKLPDLDTGTPMGAGNERSKSRLVFLATDMQSGLFAFEKDSGDGGSQSLSNIPSADSLKDGLKRAAIDKLPGAVRGMSKVKITRLSDKGFLGPNSVYGIGGTTIFRSSAGVGIGQHEETGGTFSDSKYLTSGGQDIFFKQEQGNRTTQNPSLTRVYNTSNDGDKYSDQYGGNVSGKDNYRSDADSNSAAYDRMTDLADTNPYKSRQAIRQLGIEGTIEKPDQATFITDNTELYNDFSDFGFENEGLLKGRRQYNIHDKYSSKTGKGTYDEMLGDYAGDAIEANDEAGGDDEGTIEKGGGGTFQSPLTQRFAIETNEGIGTPDNLAKLHGSNENPSDFNVSQNMRLRKYESMTYGKVTPERTTQKLMDFRELLGEANQNFHRPNGGDPEAPAWEGKDMVSRFGGNYGTMYSPTDGGIVQRGDRNNALGLEDSSVNMTDSENPEYLAEFDDLIRVKFSSISSDGGDAETLQFRAYMTNLSDGLTPSWQEVTYVGRTTPLYLFESMGREITFDLQLAAGTKSELIANYKRLNRFMQLISPEYKQGLPVAPMLKITIGDWFIDTPIIIDSFSLKPNENSPWEIDEGKQLPFYLDLTIGGKILFADKSTGDDVVQTIYARDANYFGAISQQFQPAGIYSPTE